MKIQVTVQPASQDDPIIFDRTDMSAQECSEFIDSLKCEDLGLIAGRVNGRTVIVRGSLVKNAIITIAE